MATVQCPKCQHKASVAEPIVGQPITCQLCGEPFAARTTLSSSSKPAAGAASSGSAADELPAKIGGFAVKKVLGTGAFGTVYLGHDGHLDRLVALKVPHPHTLSSPQAIERFEREARAVARLRHPHIVPVYAAGFDGASYYIASQFISSGEPVKRGQEPRGRTLAELLEDKGPLGFRRIAAMVRDLAEALDSAHGLGIVHRDVKPANVLVDAQGKVHLADFGLAHWGEGDDQLTKVGMTVGTPAYMSPEQARGRRSKVKAASDQYSLGVVLYELLCGQIPFQGPVGLVLSMHVNQEPEPPRQRRPEVPLDLETICLKALAKNPEARYWSCKALADDLRRYLKDQPIKARELALKEHGLRWIRRNFVMAGLIAAVILTLVVGTVISTYFAVQARRNADLARQEKDRADAKSAEAEAKATEARQEKDRADVMAAEAKAKATEAQQEKDRADVMAAEAKAAEALAKEYRPLDAEIAKGQVKLPDLHKANLIWQKRFYPPPFKPDQLRWFENNRLVIKTNGRLWSGGGETPASDFACEVVCRVVGPATEQGGLILANDTRNAKGEIIDTRAVQVLLNNSGMLTIGPWVYDWDPKRGPKPMAIPHAALNHGDQDNTLTVIVRGGFVEVYVNGTAVCNPVPVDGVFTQLVYLQALGHDDRGRAEFERVRVWSIRGMKTPFQTGE